MNVTPRYYRQLYSGAREVNYGNTVLVQRDSGQWWLGYVQDIDGDRYFVDFDSTTVTAEWIHASQLWPHFLLCRDVISWIGSSTQVALPTVDGGPMVFRQGTITGPFCLQYYAVRLDNDVADSSPARSIVVQRNQLVQHLPRTDAEPSIFARCNGFMYRKYVIHWDQADLLRDLVSLPKFLLQSGRIALGQQELVCNASCQFERFEIWDAVKFYCAGAHRYLNELNEVMVGCRVFVRAGSDRITFICAEMHGDTAGRSFFWDENALREACQNYTTEQQAQQAVSIRCVDRLKMMFEDAEEMSITELFHPVLADILLHLDVVTQLRISRVCLLWKILLRESGANRHIFFEFPPFSAAVPANGQMIREHYHFDYKLITMLELAVTRCTRTLAFVDQARNYDETTQFVISFPWIMSAVHNVLRTKAIRLQRIITKNGRDPVKKPGSTWLGLGRNQDNGNNYECRTLSSLKTVCEEMLLINYTASNPRLSKLAVICLFKHSGALWPANLPLRSFLSDDAHPNAAIPFLRFRPTETADAQRRRFLAAVNDSCTAVSEEDYAKVMALHAGWRQTLAYPDEWIGIRMFLQMFCPFSADDSAQCWDAVDLREIDVSTLNRLAILILAGCCEA